MRLFIAINLPDAEKGRLSKALEPLARMDLPVRWVAADSLHITLKFLGEVAENQLVRVRTAMTKAVRGISEFDVTVAGLGAFPSPSKPRIFKVGVAPVSELLQLQQRVEAECALIGFEPEQREYSPHITVGRARGRMDRITTDIDYNATLPVRAVDLMRSHVSPRGARYEVIDRMELH